MNESEYLEWLCGGCGRQYPQSIMSCDACFKLRSDDAKLVPSKSAELIREYEKIGPKPIFRRFFSLKDRIGRVELFCGILLSFAVAILLVNVFYFLGIPYGNYVAQIVSVLMMFIFASKRSRDMDFNPWLGIPLVIFTISLLMLLFYPGTADANKYGPALK
jgi:uncharacterized membrane protein YhaH (DUF805 family)